MGVWVEAIPGTLLALAVVFLPGLLLVLASGGGPVRAVGLAGPVSASILAVASVAAPAAGLAWGWLPVLAVTVAGSVAGAVLWRVRVRRSGNGGVPPAADDGGQGRAFRLALVPALLGAAVLIGWNLLQVFQSPEAVSQTADNIFHLNAVRYIQETGSASSLTAGGASGDGPGFYPAVWHGSVALVASAGVPVPLAVHCVNLVIGALVWPAGLLYFCRLLAGPSALTAVCAALSAVLFSAYPYLLIDWGVLYPNFQAMALVLPAVALCLELARALEARLLPAAFGPDAAPGGDVAGDDAGTGALVRSAWLAVLILPGLALTHPSALLAALVLVLPLAARTAARLVRGLQGTPRGLAVTLAVLLVPAVGAAWTLLRPLPVAAYANTWRPYQTTAQAAGEFLLTTHAGREAAWVTALAVAAGAGVLLRGRRERWYLVSYLLAGILFIVASGAGNSPLRTVLTGGWYDDQNRLAALTAVAGAPLAAAGLAAAARGAADGVRALLRDGSGLLPSAGTRAGFAARLGPWFGARSGAPSGVGARTAGAVAAVAVLAVAGIAAFPRIQSTVEISGREYGMSPAEPIMSTAELELYEQVADLVPEGTAVAGNPWDGSAWIYLVSGRDVVFPHVRTGMTPERLVIAERLNQAAEDPQVCEAVRRLDVGYAVRSGELIYLPGNPENEEFPGLTGLDSAAGFELVASSGDNELYRITACGE